MAEVTTTTAAAFLPEIWSKETLDAVEYAQVLAATVDTRFEGEMRTGRTLHIPHVSNLTANAKTEGTDVTYEAITQTNQDITVSTWKYAAFEINDLVQVQSSYNLRREYTDKIGYALARAIEVDLAGLPDGLSDSVGTFGVELTEDDWLSAWDKMQVGGAPAEDRFAWLSSAAVAAAMKIDKFVSRDFVAGENARAVENATVGKLFGYTVVESQLLEAPAAGQHDCGVHQRRQYILIRQQQPKVESDRIIDSLTDAVVGHVIYAVAEAEIPVETAGSETLDDGWGVWLKTV